MKQELQSLSKIFHERLFRIPDYQRGYAWLDIPHLQDFWEDMINLPDKRSHYTGVLSLKRVDDAIWSSKDQWKEDRWIIEERGYEPFHIVDGQQRLTTAVIMLATMIEFIKQLPEHVAKKSSDIKFGGYTLDAIEEQYLSVLQPGEGVIRTYIFGYESDNPSFKYMRHQILGEPYGGTIEETFYTRNLNDARQFFQGNLKKHFEDFGYKGLEEIFKTASNRLKFNVYEIGDDFDVFVAFETMNNRGKQLSNLEKLKNRLIYLTTLYGEAEVKENERIKVREEIIEAWKLTYYQLGRNKNYAPLPDDEYLRAHWTVYFRYTRQKGDDYIKYLLNERFTTHNVFNKKAIVKTEDVITELSWSETEGEEDSTDIRIEETTKPAVRAELTLSEIHDYVKKLGASALYWHATFFPFEHPNEEVSPEEKDWLDKLNRIGMGYFRPLIMAALSNRDVTSKSRIALFKAIERFIFLTMRVGKQYANYRSSTYYNFGREIYYDASAVERAISSLEADLWPIVEWDGDKRVLKPTDFKNFLSKKFHPNNVAGFYAWNALRYFLFEYEIERKGDRAEKVTWKDFMAYEKDKVSIEHIYPQTPESECWHENFHRYSDYQRQCLGASLGNLLLLSRSINSSLQNDCFEDKKHKQDKNGKVRSGYSEGSYSELQVVNQWSEWSPMAIRERGLILLDFMERRWGFSFPTEEEKGGLLFLDFLE